MDESLSMKDGKESSKSQSFKSRRDESRGMRKSKDRGGVFNLKDNTQAGDVKYVSTNSEQYDMGRVRYESVGSKGYPAEAWNYEY
jgi:hypothetical protein